MQPLEMFQPAKYSLEELQFMLDHLEETPTVALYGDVPKGVNPEAIKQALGRFAELAELEKVRQSPWSGYPPIRSSIERFLKYQAKCVELQKLGEPRHPSAMTFDSMGSMRRGGVGADASEMVRTELLENGDRVPFGVQLVGTVRPNRSAWGRKQAKATVMEKVGTPPKPEPIALDDEVLDEIKHDPVKGILECTICDKVVATYEPERGTRAMNKALAEARAHCMKAKNEQGRHRSIANVPVE